MQVSHSRVETFKQCGMKYKFRYVDGLETYFNGDPANPLIIGTALHTGIEKDVKTAIEEYFSNYPVITDQNEEEAIKLAAIIPKCKAVLPEGIYEQKIECPEFIGFIDLLVPVGKDTFDLYDFKYSNNVKNYLESGQLHEYKFYFEKTTGKKIRDLYFMFAPKVAIRMKKTETPETFRLRLRDELKDKEPQIIKVEYDVEKVKAFLQNAKECRGATKFEKSPSRLCDWCDYKDYCETGDDLMILPKNERKTNEKASYKKIWLYGLPFSGKTYLANKFPNVLMLNTDGNVKYVDAPCVPIKDEVTVEGRMTKRTFAWDIFKDTIAELEKKQNDFETIVVDLLEDTYEHCRLWCYDHLGIEHESDNSFKAWDFVRTEFLSTIKKLMNLDYNIVLISHEDSSKDITKKSGDKITAIKPNINDKVALKIAGMVDIVGRVINDDGNRTISFKTNEVIFGGGRLALKALDIPCDYKDLIAVYDSVNTVEKPAARASKPAPKQEAPKVEENEKGYPKDWDEQDDNKVHYWKHTSGAYYVQAIGQTFSDMGIDESDCVEISEADYKKALEAEPKVLKTTKADAENAGYPETATANPTETPRRTRRVRNA